MQALDSLNYELVFSAYLKETLKSHIRSSSKDNKLGALVAVLVERLRKPVLEMIEAYSTSLLKKIQELMNERDNISRELMNLKAKNMELISTNQQQAYEKLEEARAYSQTIDSLKTQLSSRQAKNQPTVIGCAASKESGLESIQKSDFSSFNHKRTFVRKQQKLSIIEATPAMPVLSSSSRVESKDEKESRLANRYRKTSCSSEEEVFQQDHRLLSKDSIDLQTRDKPINKGSSVFSRKNFSIFVTMDARMPAHLQIPTPHDDAESSMIASDIQSPSNQPILTNKNHKPSRSVGHPAKHQEGNPSADSLQSSSQQQQSLLRLEPAAGRQTPFDYVMYSSAARRRPVSRGPFLLTEIEAHAPHRKPGTGKQARAHLPTIRPSRSNAEQLL